MMWRVDAGTVRVFVRSEKHLALDLALSHLRRSGQPVAVVGPRAMTAAELDRRVQDPRSFRRYTLQELGARSALPRVFWEEPNGDPLA